MIDERKIQLTTRVVDAYISTAQPVGSRVLVQRYRLSWSTATIRNELALLEEAGYMFQPHTSAGRIPTHRAYRLYFEHLTVLRLTPTLEHSLQRMVRNLSSFDDLHELCRILSSLAGEIVFLVSSYGHISVGMRTVTQKPECHDPLFLRDLTTALDASEEIVSQIAEDISSDTVTAYIGDEETFGTLCSVFLVRLVVGDEPVFLGLIGPLRMNYQKNVSLLKTLIHNKS